MKHEIEIPDLPEGWEAVAYRCAYGNEHIFNRGMVEQISSSISKTSTERLIVRKKQPRRIVLDFDDFIIQIDSDKLWKNSGG